LWVRQVPENPLYCEGSRSASSNGREPTIS